MKEKLILSFVISAFMLVTMVLLINSMKEDFEKELAKSNGQITILAMEVFTLEGKLKNEQSQNTYYMNMINGLIELNNNEIMEKVEPSSTQPETTSYSDDSLYLLAQIVYSEANGEPFEGMVAVANVVLNRVESSKFPGTIKDVIYQEGQFQPVSNGKINNAPSEEAIEAANEAMNKRDTQGALFFYNPVIATDNWIKTLKITKTIGNHVFAG